MNIILTLDYELFFGESTGTVSRCIIQSTNRLLSVLNEFNIKAVFFVDIGFIKRLEDFKGEFPELEEDYRLISSQLKKLSADGHDLQLHIHPHWEDSYYDNGEWNINTERYRLGDWSMNEINEIVSSYKKYLEKFCGSNQVFAFRAGGWCIQPFGKMKNALKKNGIWLDSTVFEGGFNTTQSQYFDFRGAPAKQSWNFENDPLQIDPAGYFLEVPISSHKVSPIFFWKLVATKFIIKDKHVPFGDGLPMRASKKWIFKKLLLPSYSVVSLDGYKASYLNSFFSAQKNRNSNVPFVIIGHPKSLTNYSLLKLKQFILKFNSVSTFTTFAEMYKNGTLERNLGPDE